MVAQLLLGHFIADYPAQTNWLFERKVAGWPGLLMHGGVVLVAQASAVFPHTLRLSWILIGIAAVHTAQDFVKIRYGDKWFRGRPFIPYVLDQLLHIALIVVASSRMVSLVGDQPAAVRWAAAVATSLVVLTWVYYITWRVALGNPHPYPVEWRWTGKAERVLAFVAGLFGLVWLAPLAAVPRVLVARSRGASIVGERYLLLDAVLGIVLSAAAGFIITNYVRL